MASEEAESLRQDVLRIAPQLRNLNWLKSCRNVRITYPESSKSWGRLNINIDSELTTQEQQ